MPWPSKTLIFATIISLLVVTQFWVLWMAPHLYDMMTWELILVEASFLGTCAYTRHHALRGAYQHIRLFATASFKGPLALFTTILVVLLASSRLKEDLAGATSSAHLIEVQQKAKETCWDNWIDLADQSSHCRLNPSRYSCQASRTVAYFSDLEFLIHTPLRGWATQMAYATTEHEDVLCNIWFESTPTDWNTLTEAPIPTVPTIEDGLFAHRNVSPGLSARLYQSGQDGNDERSLSYREMACLCRRVDILTDPPNFFVNLYLQTRNLIWYHWQVMALTSFSVGIATLTTFVTVLLIFAVKMKKKYQCKRGSGIMPSGPLSKAAVARYDFDYSHYLQKSESNHFHPYLHTRRLMVRDAAARTLVGICSLMNRKEIVNAFGSPNELKNVQKASSKIRFKHFQASSSYNSGRAHETRMFGTYDGTISAINKECPGAPMLLHDAAWFLSADQMDQLCTGRLVLLNLKRPLRGKRSVIDPFTGNSESTVSNDGVTYSEVVKRGDTYIHPSICLPNRDAVALSYQGRRTFLFSKVCVADDSKNLPPKADSPDWLGYDQLWRVEERDVLPDGELEDYFPGIKTGEVKLLGDGHGNAIGAVVPAPVRDGHVSDRKLEDKEFAALVSISSSTPQTSNETNVLINRIDKHPDLEVKQLKSYIDVICYLRLESKLCTSLLEAARGPGNFNPLWFRLKLYLISFHRYILSCVCVPRRVVPMTYLAVTDDGLDAAAEAVSQNSQKASGQADGSVGGESRASSLGGGDTGSRGSHGQSKKKDFKGKKANDNAKGGVQAPGRKAPSASGESPRRLAKDKGVADSNVSRDPSVCAGSDFGEVCKDESKAPVCEHSVEGGRPRPNVVGKKTARPTKGDRGGTDPGGRSRPGPPSASVQQAATPTTPGTGDVGHAPHGSTVSGKPHRQKKGAATCGPVLHKSGAGDEGNKSNMPVTQDSVVAAGPPHHARGECLRTTPVPGQGAGTAN